MTDIEDFLEYSVSDKIWLDFINEKIPLIELINVNELIDYLETENEKFCRQEGFCSECRTPLQRYESKEEICGSIQTAEVYWQCPYGC